MIPVTEIRSKPLYRAYSPASSSERDKAGFPGCTQLALKFANVLPQYRNKSICRCKRERW
jgi:hypothetical protein